MGARRLEPHGKRAGQGRRRADGLAHGALAGSSDGHLWVAADFAHRFREYSGAGKLLTEIVVGAGEVRRSADAEVRQKAADAEAAQLSRGMRIFEEIAEPVTKALAEGRDGRLYSPVIGRRVVPVSTSYPRRAVWYTLC